MFNIMKTLIKKCILLSLLAVSAGCFRNDIRTETFKIEQLRNDESVKLAGQALRSVEGILEVQGDINTRTLIVKFDGLKSQLKNVEYAIVKAGFDLPNWPAQPADKAKLPEALR